MSLTDQQRTETAADNCEVLRARLAKYEDAEGRPVEWDGKSLPYDWVAAQMLFDGPDYPEDFAYGPPRMMERLRGILERYYAMRFAQKQDGSVSEITEPLDTKGSRKALGAMNARLKAKIGRLGRELAALKAQPSGVVLSDEELWSIRNQVAIHQVLRDDDSVKICVKHGRAIEQAVLARLNSSTVSAGDDRETIRAVFLRNGFTIKEGQADLKPYVYAAADELMSIARAALSAPSHGEQVRQMVPEGVTVERDVFGTIHIKSGDFDFIQIRYQYPYTDNSGTWKLAERIVALLAAPSLASLEKG